MPCAYQQNLRACVLIKELQLRGNECMQCLQTAWLFNESAFPCIALLNLPKRREVYFKQE